MDFPQMVKWTGETVILAERQQGDTKLFCFGGAEGFESNNVLK